MVVVGFKALFHCLPEEVCRRYKRSDRITVVPTEIRTPVCTFRIQERSAACLGAVWRI